MHKRLCAHDWSGTKSPGQDDGLLISRPIHEYVRSRSPLRHEYNSIPPSRRLWNTKAEDAAFLPQASKTDHTRSRESRQALWRVVMSDKKCHSKTHDLTVFSSEEGKLMPVHSSIDYTLHESTPESLLPKKLGIVYDIQDTTQVAALEQERRC